ncbi:MAG: fatty acid desaturase [Bacteroidetes bacterium]|nr:MAG: fatty acid desaturase [Bacteroidota bacterium]
MKTSYKGTFIACLVLFLWFTNLSYLLVYQTVNFNSVLVYFFIFLQTHLYTGIFITAHDAMHGLVSPNRNVNRWIGRIAAALFAFNSYDLLNSKHHLHHRFVGTDQDPDYHQGGFWVWYYHFAKQYVTWIQIVLMAISYNLLKLVFPMENLILFWIIPSILSTFQLFYFGTYKPHMGEHENVHKAGSQRKNHFWAFLSCYFFGYHYEHHSSPATPWWKLYQEKEKNDLILKK